MMFFLDNTCTRTSPHNLTEHTVYVSRGRTATHHYHLTTLYVTEFAKTDLMGTNTEIHFLPVDESHTHALSRDTKQLRLDGQVCFFRRLISDAVKPRGCISWPVWPLRGTNKTAWGAKRTLTAGLAYPVSCASLSHLLTAQHCHLCLSACFSPPSASHPPTPYRLNL